MVNRMKQYGMRFCASVLMLFTAWCGAVEQREPEATASFSQPNSVQASKLMAVTANPYATDAAYSVLLQGGSAVDAMITAQLVLNLVEPQSSGIGGGAFALRYDGEQRTISAWDGRETAPAAATPNRFLTESGQPMRWHDALVGGRSVGVPGVVALMAELHQKHGRLPWKTLFAPAIQLAEQGFIVSPRLAHLLQANINPKMTQFAETAAYFFPDGKPLQAGMRRTNPAFAHTLRHIAAQGASGFYEGPIAQKMIETVTHAKVNPGDMTRRDLTDYRVRQREVLCHDFVGYQVCGMPLPSSGGIAVAQILTMWQHVPVSGLADLAPDAVHTFTQLSRLAYADRNHYLADRDFVDVPVEALLNAEYLVKRARSISLQHDTPHVQPGQLAEPIGGQSDAPELPSTTHLVMHDAQGNAISMTSSIEMGFGSGMMVSGFLLNNQLTDFSLSPTREGVAVANRVEAGKRPLSSMAPTFVLTPQGELHMALGSPGGSRIIEYVAQVLITTLAEGMPLQAAIELPHITNRNDYTAVEANRAASLPLANALADKGHTVRQLDLNSGLHGFIRCGSQWCSGVDPRREGTAKGQ